MSTPDYLSDLAKQFAPVFAQKIDHEWKAADQLAPIDFAGDLGSVADNLKVFFDLHRDAEIANPKVYYSAVETDTHIFLIYAVYHVFDWWKHDTPGNLYDMIRDRYDEHAHDLEGALLVVRKQPRLLVDALITVSHVNFYLYTEPRRPVAGGRSRLVNGANNLHVAKFNENVDGNIWVDSGTGRVKLFIEAKGHGMKGTHSGWGGGDEVWYYQEKDIPGNAGPVNPAPDTDCKPYELEDMFTPGGLWDHRYHRGTFRQGASGKWGFTAYSELVKGTLGPSKANPPWSWDDHNDQSPMGEMATDPSRFITRYAHGWGPVSQQYTHNEYLGILSGDAV